MDDFRENPDQNDTPAQGFPDPAAPASAGSQEVTPEQPETVPEMPDVMANLSETAEPPAEDPPEQPPLSPEEDWGIPPRPPVPQQHISMTQQSMPPGVQPPYSDAPQPFVYTPQPGSAFPPPPSPYAPQYAYFPMPPEQPKIAPMNRRIYTMAAVIAVLVFLLCVYCIGSDILHGALNGSEPDSIKVTVKLITQEKPDLDPRDENVTADGEYTVKGVAELVKPSIVEVYTYSSNSRRKADLEGTGSGIIISEDGYIVTNAHVVQGEAFSVILDDESEYIAELVGSDNKTDLAVLKINASGLTPAVLGNSDETYVGENVVAIGNPAGLTNTVTKGIVSAINRQVRAESNAFVMDCIQTDAAISPGNSGGALVNMYGQVIGITSSKYASSYSSVYEGLGFAITINEALPVLTDLMEEGYVSGRFRIGITFIDMADNNMDERFEEEFGMEMPEALAGSIWIQEVSEECDISNTDLQPDDFIISFDGKNVSDYEDVRDVLAGYKGGDTVTALCVRIVDGDVRYFEIEFMLEEDTSGNF